MSDQALRRHLAAGVDREQELIVRSGAGGRCGGCRPQLRRLLAEHAATTAAGPRPDRCSTGPMAATPPA